MIKLLRVRLRWIARLSPAVLLAVVLAAPRAFARIGGGEHYQGSSDDNSSGDDGAVGMLIDLIWFALRYPKVGVPILVIAIGIYWWWRRSNSDGSTRRAIERADALRKTQVSAEQVDRWVNAVRAKDPSFDLLHLFDQTKRLFLDTQAAWLKQDLEPVRRSLSDATFQRLVTQLRLLRVQGVRDAMADLAVLELQLIGLEQSEWFDTVHIRVRATARDADVPAEYGFDQAEAAARKEPAHDFIEVWSLVRKPGVATKAGQELSSGKCPNCGAPFLGGAANRCDHCGAVVNSGNYDWVLAEITQGSEFHPQDGAVQGLAQARQTDPALNTEVLEDRASLAFWRWVSAQSGGDASAIARISTPELTQTLDAELKAIAAGGKRRMFLECAVGAVSTVSIERQGEHQLAHVDIRWSVKAYLAPLDAGGEPAKPDAKLRDAVITAPQRSVFSFTRAVGAKTNTGNGMATTRCPNCSAPEPISGELRCSFCGTPFNDGTKEWALSSVRTWEAFQAVAHTVSKPSVGNGATAVVDRDERERLLYMMVALAQADGVVDASEKALLKMCAERWGIPWMKVELVLSIDASTMFDKLLVAKATPAAEQFLQQLVEIARADGRIDRRERKMLEAAATRLGLSERLRAMIQ